MNQTLSIDKIVRITVAAMILCAILSYFIKPRPPQLELVIPQQELSAYRPAFPGDTRLADRIVKSYALAIVLEQSPYLQKNINSLEAIREWAHDNFQQTPDFLHPSTIATSPAGRDTVFGALGYNIFASVRYSLQSACGEFLRMQISRWHQTTGYRSFNAAYFDFFGTDSEAATLLARYQTDRAKLAIDVVLWSTVWLAALLTGAVFLARGRRFFQRLKVVTATTWALLSIIYASQSWADGHAQALFASILCAAFCIYLCKPVALLQYRSGGKRLSSIKLPNRWIALSAWFTLTCLSIQVITWIKTGIPSVPDPVTLLLCSLTGNFVHDPAHGKRWIALTTAILWLLASIWTLWQQYRLEPLPAESELGPDSMMNRLPFESTLN